MDLIIFNRWLVHHYFTVAYRGGQRGRFAPGGTLREAAKTGKRKKEKRRKKERREKKEEKKKKEKRKKENNGESM